MSYRFLSVCDRFMHERKRVSEKMGVRERGRRKWNILRLRYTRNWSAIANKRDSPYNFIDGNRNGTPLKPVGNIFRLLCRNRMETVFSIKENCANEKFDILNAVHPSISHIYVYCAYADTNTTTIRTPTRSIACTRTTTHTFMSVSSYVNL